MKKNLPLIIGLALPILFIIIIAIVVYLPSNFVNPQHNFIYKEQSYDSYRNDVVIVGDKVSLAPTNITEKGIVADPYLQVKDYPKIYLYDFSKNASYEISLEEAQKFSVAKGPSSPDGYSIERNYNHRGIFKIFSFLLSALQTALATILPDSVALSIEYVPVVVLLYDPPINKFVIGVFGLGLY